MREHLENLKQKPVHVRERIAFGTAAGATLLIAIVWLTVHVSSGTFALNQQQGNEQPTNLADAKSSVSNLLGAAGQALGATSTPPALTVVSTATTSTLNTSAPQNQTGATSISF